MTTTQLIILLVLFSINNIAFLLLGYKLKQVEPIKETAPIPNKQRFKLSFKHRVGNVIDSFKKDKESIHTEERTPFTL